MQIILKTIINDVIKMEKTNREIIESILVEIKPNLKKKIKNKKLNLIHEGLIDSFDIIQLIIKIEKQTNKKIKLVKFDRSSFATVDQIIKLLWNLNKWKVIVKKI